MEKGILTHAIVEAAKAPSSLTPKTVMEMTQLLRKT